MVNSLLEGGSLLRIFYGFMVVECDICVLVVPCGGFSIVRFLSHDLQRLLDLNERDGSIKLDWSDVETDKSKVLG